MSMNTDRCLPALLRIMIGDAFAIQISLIRQLLE